MVTTLTVLKSIHVLAATVLGTGIWMTAKYYDFGDVWIALSLAGTAIATLVILLCIVPRTRAAVIALEQGSGPPPRPSRVPTVARLNLLLVSAIVAIMVIRPT